METIWVTGANGQLGSELRMLTGAYTKYQFKFTNAAQLDITNYSAVTQFLEEEKITVLFNCAAYTAVDKAENEVFLANEINHKAVAHLANEAKRLGVKMIHISTDYVFDGVAKVACTETDIPNPQSVYGTTKLDGENAMIVVAPKNSIIIRTAWVYSSFGGNFVKTMLRLGKERDNISVVNDQVGSPTYAADLASVMLELIPKLNSNTVELYHYTNEGQCTWFTFAQAIFDSAKIDIEVHPIATSSYPTPAKRPSFSLLDKNKIKKKFGIEIRNWESAIVDCLDKFQD